MRYELPGFTAKPKARPRAGRGVMFVPKPYQEWKRAVRDYLAAHYSPTPTLSPVALFIELHGPSKGRGDIDNLAGGLLDAIQPARAKGDVRAQRALEAVTTLEERLAGSPGCLIADDAQLVALSIRWVKSKKKAIVIDIIEIEESVA